MKRIISTVLWAVLFVTAILSFNLVKKNSETPVPFGEEHAIIRVFDPDGMTMQEISAVRFAVADATSESEGRGWCDAYSYFETLTVSREDGEGIECNVTVTSSDFFLFHQAEFISGWYYTDSDNHLDRIAIDEKLAFALFGSSDVVDMTVKVGGKTLYISGVFESPESDAYIAQMGEKPHVYIPENIARDFFGDRPFDNYEVMMENPVTDHALIVISAVCQGKTVVDVTSRFGVLRLLSLIKEFPTRSYNTLKYPFPYFENEDRGAEDTLALILILVIVTAVIFTVNIAILTVRVIRVRRNK